MQRLQKTCNGPCGRDLPLESFPWRNKAKGYRMHLCAECRSLKQSADRSTSEYQAKKRALYERVRLEVLAMLGGACACCGETEPAFLALDHIDGVDGERQTGLALYYRVRRDAAYRALFQALCHNCNYAKSQPGGCPHRRRLRAVA